MPVELRLAAKRLLERATRPHLHLSMHLLATQHKANRLPRQVLLKQHPWSHLKKKKKQIRW